MYHKVSKSPFRQITPTQYPEGGNLFTKALKQKPSIKQQQAIMINHPVHIVNPQMIYKKAPPSPVGKGLIPIKIDYTCDEEFISNKNEGDSALICKQTLNNDNSLFCNQQLKLSPSAKPQSKNKHYQISHPSPLNHYTQAPIIPLPSPIEQEYKKIFERTAAILQTYEQDKIKQEGFKRQLQMRNRQLESQNRSLKQRLYYYQKQGKI